METDYTEVLRYYQEKTMATVVIVAKWPMSDQSVILIAHHLEAHGIATIIVDWDEESWSITDYHSFYAVIVPARVQTAGKSFDL